MYLMPLALDTVNYRGRGPHPPPLPVAAGTQRGRALRHERGNEAGCGISSNRNDKSRRHQPAVEKRKSRNGSAAFSPPACAGSRDASCITRRRGGGNVFLEESDKSYEDRRRVRDRPRTYPTARLFQMSVHDPRLPLAQPILRDHIPEAEDGGFALFEILRC